jgi:GTP-binding protein
MKITQAEYVLSAVRPDQYPSSGLREIALAGRSNVGKSSLINRFVNRKNLARTSGVPGKTRALNFYCVNQLWHFVDLPGYGYARASRGDREQWRRFVNRYLENRAALAGIIQLVDMRHEPTQNDRMMYDWICYYGYPRLVAATKADKVSKGHWLKHSGQIRNGLGMAPEVPLILFSAKTGLGVDALAQWIAALLNLEPSAP